MSSGAARKSSAIVALSLGKSVAQVAIQFAPVPALGPVAGAICILMELCVNVTQNRHSAHQLEERCHRLALVVYDKAMLKEDVTSKVEDVLRCLEQIKVRMQHWTTLGNVKAFLRQQEIAKDIEYCHGLLSDCFASFQLKSQMETQDWQSQLTLNNEQDHRELVEYLTNIQNSQTLIQEMVHSQREDTQNLMLMMQRLMAENIRTAERQHNGLSSNLYDIQTHSQELLPDFHLRRGEVIRIGQFPISGTTAMDIYEGLYLQREKVAIKVVRAVNSDESSLRRFEREVAIWKEVWKRDGGRHVLPFYGFSQNDGPFPYMVSPWMPNGTALTYVKQKDATIDYIRLITGIAQGIQVLHSMSPPVVHGDVKGSNIVVDSFGNPLLADFGLSRIVEDITGIPFSQSRGVSDSYRWFAPEVCIGQGALSLSSDIYAYGMTVLELFTHLQPFNEIKHTTEVVIRSSQGKQPTRPTDPPVLARGLDDSLWVLLQQCWANPPSERPTIGQVLAALQSRN
ncbi:TKL/TKL-ccin protein kinase [Mycena chlorophos]|uniref:TKL/TKL-ccin protein kinase n=1 Tax=Mycena chlorophos TaxID=658473 RepID=A0A8H6TA29_MYCCL|nr:TKL/TKL-ccin protein kinase [Mycena chlorophos]